MNAKTFLDYFRTDKSTVNSENQSPQTEKPTNSGQCEEESEDPKMQQINKSSAVSSEREDSCKSSKKQKLNESPVMDHSGQSNSKNGETGSTSSVSIIAIDEDSNVEQMDAGASHSDDKSEANGENNKRTLRDRSKLKSLGKSLRSSGMPGDEQKLLSSDDSDSDFVLEESSESDEDYDEEMDFRRVGKRNTTSALYSFNKGNDETSKCDKVSERDPVDYRPNAVNSGKKESVQAGTNVTTENDSSAADALPKDRTPGAEYSFINSGGLKIVYGVEYRPSE